MNRISRFRSWAGALAVLPLLLLSSGCIMLAVRGVKLLDRPQKTLIAFGNYYGDTVSVSAWLAPVTKHSRMLGAVTGDEEVGILNPAEEDEPEAKPAAGDKDSEDPKFHKKLFVVVRNLSAAPETITVVAVKSPLGDLTPRPPTLLLAPGQRGILAPLLSTSEPKLEYLDVTVTLRENDKEETHTLRLLPRVKD